MKVLNGKKMVLLAIGVAAVLLAGLSLLLFDQNVDKRKSLLLITVDTLRADRVGAYGYKGPISPRMDAFAKEAVLFEKASATAPFTAPSHASILTSQHPSNHGIVFNGNRKSEKMADALLGDTPDFFSTAVGTDEAVEHLADWRAGHVLDGKYEILERIATTEHCRIYLARELY